MVERHCVDTMGCDGDVIVQQRGLIRRIEAGEMEFAMEITPGRCFWFSRPWISSSKR